MLHFLWSTSPLSPSILFIYPRPHIGIIHQLQSLPLSWAPNIKHVSSNTVCPCSVFATGLKSSHGSKKSSSPRWDCLACPSRESLLLLVELRRRGIHLFLQAQVVVPLNRRDFFSDVVLEEQGLPSCGGIPMPIAFLLTSEALPRRRSCRLQSPRQTLRNLIPCRNKDPPHCQKIWIFTSKASFLCQLLKPCHR
jgi:hypothetical protein